jgi:HK97 family phage major capsid protein
MDKETVEEVNKAFHEFKRKVNEKLPDDATLEKIEKVFEDYEVKNQELATAQQHILGAAYEVTELKNELQAQKVNDGVIRTKVEMLQAELARGSAGSGDDRPYTEAEEFKALAKWCQKGEALDLETKALLRTDSAVDGGTLVPEEMDTEIIKQITELDAMRSICRVRTINTKSIDIPVRTAIPAAVYEGEAETGTDSTSQYGNETLTPYRQTFTTPVTQDQLMNGGNGFNMEQEILSDAAESFATGEGQKFVTGTGFKEPEGFIINSVVAAAALTGTGVVSGKFNPADLILMAGELKVGYNPVYVLDRKTLAAIRAHRVYVDDSGTLVDGTGAGTFLWNPSIDSGNPAMLNGHPYVLMSSMPDEGSSALSVAFGDFRRGYTIVDRTGMSVIRDNTTLKKQAIVEFTMNRWNTGQVVLADAIVVQKCLA